MGVIRVGNGYLTLRSEKAEKLVLDLSRSGTLWEHISELIEKDANSQQDAALLNQVLAHLRRIETTALSGGIGTSVSDSPTVGREIDIPVSPKGELKIQEVSISSMKKSPKDVIRNMRNRKGGE